MAPKEVFVCSVVILAMAAFVTSSVIHRRSAVPESLPGTEVAPTKTCYDSSPCGWLVYTPITRKPDFFMKNTCVCSQDKICVQTEDDISIGAFVYRCRPESAQGDQQQAPSES